VDSLAASTKVKKEAGFSGDTKVWIRYYQICIKSNKKIRFFPVSSLFYFRLFGSAIKKDQTISQKIKVSFAYAMCSSTCSFWAT